MLRSAFAVSSRTLQRLCSGAPHAIQNNTSTRTPYVGSRRSAIAAATTAVFLLYLSNSRVHNDAARTLLESKLGSTHSEPTNSTGLDKDGVLRPVVWGSNKSNLIDPKLPGVETFQTPVNAEWLENIALRDMALHEQHAACVDARGDVYQWGSGFFGPNSDVKTPKATLRGKNIIRVQLTGSRVYALSASGRVYTFAANEEGQRLPKLRTPSTTSWGLSSWTGAEQQTIDFVEIFPREKLTWGETFISIAAGSDHLLVLSSKGRVYAHPMNKDANSYGQLGLRRVDILASSNSPEIADLSARPVPESYTKTSPLLQQPSLTVASEHSDVIGDRHIRFSDGLFEIPSLRGVKVSQIAAGGRSSFVNTNSGTVLGWGVNEHGQIGLGSGVTLDTIIVPTEVDLTRNIPVSTNSRCLSIAAGGDLTCFVVERTTRESFTYVDVLCCGNGQWGGLGNNTFSTFQGSPVRVRNISGLREFDEQEQKLSPIVPHAISVSPTGHILLSLDTQSRAGPGGSGRDLVVWGLNHDYQLGTGKRTSLGMATTLDRPEGGRFILSRRKAVVKDLSGRVWGNNVEVEQCVVAGYGNSVVYWKIRR